MRARYVVGCDGARSVVRQSIGRELRGDPANHAWGVMDILAVTDFPDIRIKAAIQSGNQGNIVLIPREGGYLVRLYVDLGEVDPAARAAVRAMSSDEVIAIARRVLHPYTLEVKEIAWFSIYEVGQRLADKFDDVPAELAGVPHAARVHRRRRLPHPQRQGRPGHERVDAGRLQPRLEARRRARGPQPRIAAAHLLGGAPGDRQGADRLRQGVVGDHGLAAEGPREPGCAAASTPPSCRSTSCSRCATRPASPPVYTPSTLDRRGDPPASRQGFHDRDAVPLGTGHSPRRRQAGAARPLPPRRRPVAAVRVRRRRRPGRPGVTAAGAVRAPRTAVDSLVPRYTPAGADLDGVFDVRAVFQQYHRDLRLEDLPSLLLPQKGRYGLDRLREGVRARLDNRRRRHLRPARHRPRPGCARRRAPRPVRRPRAAARRLRPSWPPTSPRSFRRRRAAVGRTGGAVISRLLLGGFSDNSQQRVSGCGDGW